MINTMRTEKKPSFEEVWEKYVTKLKGRAIRLGKNGTNLIISVSAEGIERKTSQNNVGFIPIDIFRWCYSYMLENKSLERKEINYHFPKRLSSGTFAILKEIPLFEYADFPCLTLFWREK